MANNETKKIIKFISLMSHTTALLINFKGTEISIHVLIMKDVTIPGGVMFWAISCGSCFYSLIFDFWKENKTRNRSHFILQLPLPKHEEVNVDTYN